MDAYPFARFDVVLVRTMNPENLGAVARLQDNFGFASLTLVRPRVDVRDTRAEVVARTAREHLGRARVVQSLEEAVAPASFVVGLTARRGDERPTLHLRDAVARLSRIEAPERVALVFGPEDTGLAGDEVDACDLLATIPTPGPLGSLNLGQAVALVMWELTQAGRAPATEESRGGATREDVEGFLAHAFEALDAFDYFREHDRERRRTHLRRVLTSARLTKDEVQGLRGLCRQVLWVLERAKRGEWPPKKDEESRS